MAGEMRLIKLVCLTWTKLKGMTGIYLLSFTTYREERVRLLSEGCSQITRSKGWKMKPQIFGHMENTIYIGTAKYRRRMSRDAVKSLPSDMFNTRLVKAGSVYSDFSKFSPGSWIRRSPGIFSNSNFSMSV